MQPSTDGPHLPLPRLLKLVATALAVLVGTPGAGRPAALVGTSTRVEAEAASVSARQDMRDAYRQPDAIPFPADDPYTPAKARLGRTLFYDPRLSGSGAVSCASCHSPGFGFGDGRAKAVGPDLKPLDRRSLSVMNCAWGVTYMWDGRATSLEAQALLPLAAPAEMDLPLDRLAPALSAIPGYAPLFAAAFPAQPITPATVASAIATYERTIVSVDSPFDRWIAGDEAAVSGSAKRGFDLFNGKARCAACHLGWAFTDDGFHDTGLPGDDPGRGRLLPAVAKMQHAFKTPGLRETARRAPYMHDGSLPTLSAVLAHYNAGGVDRPSRSELIGPLGLSPVEQADIVAFLEALTSPVPAGAFPVLPR